MTPYAVNKPKFVNIASGNGFATGAEASHLSSISCQYAHKYEFTAKPKYADDISYASTPQPFITCTNFSVPDQVHKYYLQVNETKIEEYKAGESANF